MQHDHQPNHTVEEALQEHLTLNSTDEQSAWSAHVELRFSQHHYKEGTRQSFAWLPHDHATEGHEPAQHHEPAPHGGA
jgi:hypothetical protein